MRKEYIKPTVFCRQLKIEGLMYTASPGAKGEYDDDLVIEAKRQNRIIEDDSDEDLWKGL